MSDKRSTRRGGFYFVDDKPYVSVTNVLKVLDKPALMYWFGQGVYHAMVLDPTLGEKEALSAPYRVSERAMNRGTTVHSVIEAFKAGAPRIKTIETIQPYVDAFYRWFDDYNPTIVENEKTVVSHAYRYAGTIDMIANLNGENVVIDIKTNKDGNVYPEAFLQVSAYINALNEAKLDIKRGFVVALSESGKYTCKEVEYCFDEFLSAKHLWEWTNKAKCEKLGYTSKK